MKPRKINQFFELREVLDIEPKKRQSQIQEVPDTSTEEEESHDDNDWNSTEELIEPQHQEPAVKLQEERVRNRSRSEEQVRRWNQY